MLDTEGKDLPEDVASFIARGTIDDKRISSFVLLTSKKNIEWYRIDAGDQTAGSIRVIKTNCATEVPLTRATAFAP